MGEGCHRGEDQGRVDDVSIDPKAMTTTLHHFPATIADLGFAVELPAGWTVQPLPEQSDDFDDPTAMVALAIVTAPYAAIVFAFAARPAYSDGTLLDWTRYLLEANAIQPLALGVQQAGHSPAWIGEALQQSDLGPMRVRFAFIEDGARIVNITMTAPDTLAASVQAAWFDALRSFRLEHARGMTVPMQPEVEIPESSNVPGQSELAEYPDPPAPEPSAPANDGLPDWWHEAVRLERDDKLEEAELAVARGAPHIGACITLAGLFRDRMVRLHEAGDVDGARAARKRAEDWAFQYASQATSGGEGAALSRERDAFIESLGPAF